jgi:hypothetical protein
MRRALGGADGEPREGLSGSSGRDSATKETCTPAPSHPTGKYAPNIAKATAKSVESRTAGRFLLAHMTSDGWDAIKKHFGCFPVARPHSRMT